MKKIIIILTIIISILVINKEEIVIPKDSIRFRIIANSNSVEDQKLKREILNSLHNNIELPSNINNIKDARTYIKKQLPNYERIVQNTLNNNSNNKNYTINYGLNYFPEKKYNNIKYEAGEYESLVITIGDGIGNNFWCVLFPPLCLVDEDNKQYPSLVKEILSKYF